ncbi:LysM peptidoglycan-binding domain-containing protein [Melghiribacillus thermohalophilus]|nr:LysM peptidoglycan-binding domain-containing protein [Melghiribacillus thermohalophilus]
MENQEHNSYDQASKLRDQMYDHKNKEEKSSEPFDVMSLPPRSEIHRKNKEKKQINWSMILLRIIVILFLILIILIPIYYWEKNGSQNTPSTASSGDSPGEEIEIIHQSIVLDPDMNKKGLDFDRQTGSGDRIEPEDEEKNTKDKQEVEEEIPDHTENKTNIIDSETKQDPETGSEETADLPQNENTNKNGNQNDNQETEAEPEAEMIYYTVQQGDTLFSVSQKFYGGRFGEEMIRHANGLEGNSIYVGQVLKIPINE